MIVYFKLNHHVHKLGQTVTQFNGLRKSSASFKVNFGIRIDIEWMNLTNGPMFSVSMLKLNRSTLQQSDVMVLFIVMQCYAH